MEKKIRALLLKILGFERYLSFVSYWYIRITLAGFLKKKYPELFHLQRLIKPGFVCVDIGANVGYYSTFLSRYAGSGGHVYAVEPVALFATIFRKNTSRFALRNITLYQTALGASRGNVVMGTPVIDGVLRHGLTHIISREESAGMQTYEVPLQVPDELFAGLSRLDFIKCDVEGYEVHLFPHLFKTLEKFKPLIQLEISSSANRQQIFILLHPIGYEPYKLAGEKLYRMTTEEALHYEGGDFYLLPSGT